MTIMGVKLRRCALACGVAMLAMAPQIAVAQGDSAVQVAAQPLEQSLKEVARQTGTNILFTADTVRAYRGRPLSGRMNALEAVQMLIAGTGLEAVGDGNGGLIVRRKAPRTSQSEPAPQPVAQDLPQDEADVEAEEALVVTGSQIRGIEPVGSNVTQVTREEIKATGVIDTNQVLAQLPQSNFFLVMPQPGLNSIVQGAPRVPINRPNLRNIPGTTNGSGSPTLVLIDGHRVTPAGIEQSAVDAGIVPPGILERVEVLLDGTSAVYGSDAVGGVINFITRKRFKGTEVSARLGAADNYYQTDASITHGTTWDTGGITFNLDYARNSNLYTRDRDALAPINWLPSSLAGLAVDDLACDVPNITAGAARAHVEGSGVGSGYRFCDGSAYTTFQPALERYGAFVTFSQDITSWAKFEVTGLYSRRTQTANQGPFTGSVTVRPNHPYYRASAAAPGNQTVQFSLGPLLGNSGEAGSQWAQTVTEVGQIAPELTFELGGGWQTRALFVYGKSRTSVDQTRLNALGLSALFPSANNGLIAAGSTINPYDIASSTPAQRALVEATLWHNQSKAIQTFYDGRVSADGPLFALPGGEVRAAVGVEWSKTDFKVRTTNQSTFVLQPYRSSSGENKSAFAELVVPVFGEGNATPGFHSLTLSASGRYDRYVQYGDTFNPKFATTWEPVEWLTLRGNWSKSFRAPNAVDKLAATGTLIRCLGQVGCAAGTNIPSVGGVNYNLPAGHNNVALYLTGTVGTLKPETSTSWSVGADIDVPFVEGLRLSASYYNIDFKNFISTPNISADITTIRRDFGAVLFPVCSAGECSAAFVNDFYAQADSGPAVQQFVTNGGFNPVYYIDGRTRNLGGAKIQGIDLSARYRRETGFGSVDASWSGSWSLKNEVANGNFVSDELAFNNPIFRMTASAGANIGDFRAQATVRHQDGYAVTPGDANRLPSQTHIGSFTVADLIFTWDVNGSDAWSKDVTFSLNINNVLDTDPPLSKTSGGGTANGQTLGRLFELGITKKF